uniref:Calponin-homology (CH) domain-containing protein n=1 Tax=Acrobeloides nanus TaxID=290746 RepID=A0A914CYC1_9BILA
MLISRAPFFYRIFAVDGAGVLSFHGHSVTVRFPLSSSVHERDAIQKKTFTKWVNKHLTKTGRRVEDLFLDLRDGFNLIALLEALSAETLVEKT